MVLVRAMDVLVARKHPKDDGVFSDLTKKQRMPVCEGLEKIALQFTEDSKTNSGINDIYCLVKAVNRIFIDAGAPIPFSFGTGLEGKNYNLKLFFLVIPITVNW